LLGIPAFDLNGSGNEAQCILEIVIGDLQGLPEILGNRGVGSANVNEFIQSTHDTEKNKK